MMPYQVSSGFKFGFFVYKPIARAIGLKAWKPNLCSFGQNWRSDIIFLDISEGEFSWVGYNDNDVRVKGYLYDQELIKITSSPQEFCSAMNVFLEKKFATFCHENLTPHKVRAVVIEGSHVFLSELKSHLKATWFDLEVYEMDSEVTTLGAAAICYQLLNDTEVVASSKSLKFSLKDNGCHVCWKGSDAGGRWNAANYEYKSGKIEKKIVINADVPKWGYCALREPALCNISNCYGEHNCKFCSYKRDQWKYYDFFELGSEEFYKDDDDSIELAKKQIMVCPVSENMEGDALKVKDARKARYGYIIVVGEDKEKVGVIRREKMGTCKMSLVNMLNFLRDEVGPAIP